MKRLRIRELRMDQAATRREFLSAAGSLAAAAVVSRAAPLCAADPPPRKFRKAVKMSMVAGKAPLVRKFKMLKELGFDGIDMDRPADRGEVAQAQQESGLIVHGVVDYVHWQQPLSH